MIAKSLLFRRSFLRPAVTVAACAALALLPACKKKDAAAGGEGVPVGEQPAGEQTPKEEPVVELKAKWPAGRRAVVRLERSVEMEPTTTSAQPSAKLEAVLTTEIAFKTLKEREGGGSNGHRPHPTDRL